MAFIDLALGAATVLLATSAGAVGILAFDRIDRLKYSIMLSFASGAMAFSSIEMLMQSHAKSGDAVMMAGLLAGIAVLIATEKLLPHVHRRIGKKELTDSKKKAALIAGSIALHNIPEGFAVATAFAASAPIGWFITTSIALQDIPEGTLVSAPLVAYGMGQKRSVFYGVFSGFVEAATAVAGYLFLSTFAALIPFALAFSAGAMTYVVFVELLPDAVESGMERVAAISFVIGALVTFAIASVLAV